MKKLTFSVVVFALFGVGCAVGYSINKPANAQNCNCKLEESKAIKGCEIAAIQIHNLLQRCEYKLSHTEEMVQQYCEKLFQERQ